MNIQERINKEVTDQPDWEADQIAERIQRFCSKQDYWPLLIAAIQNRQRMHTRLMEDQRFAELMANLRPDPLPLPSMPAQSIGDFLPLLRRPIQIGDGTRSSWGMATVDQHRLRLAMLMAQRNGLTQTIHRHEEAIRLLEESGASCLAALADVREKAA